MIWARVFPVALVLAAGVGAARAEPLTEFRWLAPGADAAAQATRAPAECLKPASNAEDAYKIEVGRVVFRTPELFGGQAARVGLSCNACHINGRNNATFFIDGVSGLPGTVDVTTSVFSKTRGDGVMNPRPIPSLVGTAFNTAYGHDAKVTSLREFVHGVAVEEFQGAEPDPQVFDALMVYVTALDPVGCTGPDTVAITLKSTLSDLDRGLAALDASADRGDKAVGDLLVLGLRTMLGRLNERYAGAGLTEVTPEIVGASRGLEKLWHDNAGKPAAFHAGLKTWRDDFHRVEARLTTLESKSLFNPVIVTRVVGESAADH
jgi:cytochrome c peroxidase